MMVKRRVMIIDDSVVARRAISNAIMATDDIEVAASAANGRIGLAKLERVKPDLVLLDVEMPEMDGLETLAAIRTEYPQLPVIMFSALTGRGAQITLEALALGANDYATKPTSSKGSMEDQLNTELFPKIRALCRAKGAPPSIDIEPAVERSRTPRRRTEPPQALVIGSSTGGPNALAEIVAELPRRFPVPVLVVQHMPAIFTRLLAERLDRLTELSVTEARDGDAIQRGTVYIAPGDYHLAVVRRQTRVVVELNQGPQENSCRPAVDVLFRSAAEVYGAGTLAVVLTGMGRDGLEGCRRLFDAGGQIICQDEASSVVWGMPGYVARANLADDVVALTGIGAEIIKRLRVEPSGVRAGATPWS